MKKVENKTQALILLVILIAIGGVVLYGKEYRPSKKIQAPENTLTPPIIKGPSTPPPGYVTPR